VLGTSEGTVKTLYHNRKFLKSSSEIPEDATFGLILDRTSFYAESGGQEYDTGNIVIDGVADFEVSNVQVFNGYVLHIGHLKYGKIDVGNDVVCSYDEVRPFNILEFTEADRKAHNLSSGGGLCATTTPRRTYSTTHCARCSGTTSTRRARWWRQRSCASTFRTRRRSACPS
jgi:hypothetical protein